MKINSEEVINVKVICTYLPKYNYKIRNVLRYRRFVIQILHRRFAIKEFSKVFF